MKKIFAFLLLVSSIASAQTRVIHKFTKVGVAFTYQADNGASVAPQQVTQSNVNDAGTLLRIFFNNAWYINVLPSDSVVINGSGVTGSLVTKRNQLLSDVFPSIGGGGGSGGSTTTGQLSADSVNDGSTKKAFLATERTKLAGTLDSAALKNKIRDSLNALRASLGTPEIYVSDLFTGAGTSSGDPLDLDTVNRIATKTNLAGKQQSLGWIIPIGLVPGGTADNKSVIQTAVNLVNSAGGGVVYLPPGVWGISSRIDMKDSVTILGAGMGVTVIKATSTFTDAADATYGALFLSQGASYIAYKNITLTGNTEQISGGVIRINSKQPTGATNNQEYNFVFENLELKNVWGRGIRFGGYASGESHSNSGVYINNCHFVNMFNPSDPYEDVDQEFAERCDAIFLGGATKRVVITNCFFKNLSGDAVRGDGWFYTVPSSTIPVNDWQSVTIANIDVENAWMGIEFEGYLAGSKNSITNSRFRNMNRPSLGAYCISAGGIGLKVNNNYFENVETGLCEIGGSNIEFIGNTGKITVAKSGTGSSHNPGFNNSSNVIGFVGFNATVSTITSNHFIYDPRYDNRTIAATRCYGISIAGAQGSTLFYDDSTTENTIISSNTLIGCTERFVQSSNQLNLGVNIKSNTFISKFMRSSESAVLIWGQNWDVSNNTFNFTKSATSGNVIGISGSQSGNAKSIITNNIVFNDNWKISTSSNYIAFNNHYVDSTGVAYTVDEIPRITNAQRSALTAREGMIVYQTDGTAGKYLYTASAWALQGSGGGGGGGLTATTIYLEDFLNAVQGSNLTATQSGTGASAGSAIAPTVDGAYGMVQVNTGTTTTGRAYMGSHVDALYSGSWLTSGTMTMEFKNVRLVNKSTGTETFKFVAGFHDSPTAPDATEGAYFITSTSNDSLYMVVSNASTRTTVAVAGIVMSDNIKIASLKITIDCGAQTAYFYYNGTLKGTITTNIPQDTFGFGIGIFKSAGTTARRFDIDRISLAVTD